MGKWKFDVSESDCSEPQWDGPWRIVAANHPEHPHFHPLGFQLVKNQDVSTRPLLCPFAGLLTPPTYLLAWTVAVNHPSYPHFHPLWFRLVKNQDESTGPLTCQFARSLLPLIHLLALHCLLCLHTPLRSFICSLDHCHSLAHEADCPTTVSQKREWDPSCPQLMYIHTSLAYISQIFLHHRCARLEFMVGIDTWILHKVC